LTAGTSSSAEDSPSFKTASSSTDIVVLCQSLKMPAYDDLCLKRFEFNRQISSLKDSLPSGSVEGHVEFLPLEDDTLLYKEQGTFYTDTGLALNVTSSYIWHFTSEEALAIYFVKPGTQYRDYLFLKLEDSLTGVHPCGKDLYHAHFEFPTMQEFLIRYRVEGPLKDYTSDTLYTYAGRVLQDENRRS
jgi:hypothetical protein